MCGIDGAAWVARALEREAMFATIQISPYISAQGQVLRRLPSGVVAINVAGREMVGPPLAQPQQRNAAAPQPEHA